MITCRALHGTSFRSFYQVFRSFFLFIVTLFVLIQLSQSADAATLTVQAGGDFQSALNAAQAGDVIILEAGGVFTGPFTLPVKGGAEYITIQSSQLSALPGSGQRVSPHHAALMPRLISPGKGQPAVQTAAGAHHFRFIGVEFAPQDANAVIYDLVRFGDGDSQAQDSLEKVPHHLVLDRCYIHALAGQGLKRGVALNSAHTEVLGCYISDFKAQGQDSQAISGWNGPGPFRIINNYLEAAGENVMFGGSDPRIAGLVPSDIEIRRNHLAKQLSWRQGEANFGGVAWQVKNLLELKNAQRVVIDGNLMENSWAHAQAGYAVLFTVRNQDGGAPWSVVQDVEFTNNLVQHASSGVQLLGTDYYHPSQQTKRIKIVNNVFADINGERWGGRGWFLQFSGGVADLRVDHNTVVQTGAITSGEGENTGVVFTNNIVANGDYGMHCANNGECMPQRVVSGNVIVGGAARSYPAGNYFAASYGEVGFIDFANAIFKLAPSSRYKRRAKGGKDIGVDFDVVNAAAKAAKSGIWEAP